MPFQLYTDKSLVVWGNQDYLDAGDQRHGECAFIELGVLHVLKTCRCGCEPGHQAALLLTAGINTGILLLRNDDGFSPTFWKDVALVSRINLHVERNASTPEGRIKVRTLEMSSATVARQGATARITPLLAQTETLSDTSNQC